MKQVISFIAFVTILSNLYAYDFTAVASSGQTLYFEYVYSSNWNYSAKLVCPYSGGTPYPSRTTAPSGNVVIPTAVTVRNLMLSRACLPQHTLNLVEAKKLCIFAKVIQ